MYVCWLVSVDLLVCHNFLIVIHDIHFFVCVKHDHQTVLTVELGGVHVDCLECGGDEGGEPALLTRPTHRNISHKYFF